MRKTYVFRNGRVVEKPVEEDPKKAFTIGTPIEGFYEHLSNDGVHIKSRKQLRTECRIREKYAPYVLW